MTHTFTDPSPVVVGAATKKSFWDKVYENTFWLRDNRGVLDYQHTPVGNVGTGWDQLMSYVLPAERCDVVGKGIRFTALGSKANNANSKAIRVKFAGVTLGEIPASTVANRSWRWTGEFMNGGAGGCQASSVYSETDSSGTGKTIVCNYEWGPPDWATALTLEFQAEGVATDDITMGMLIVEIL